MPDSKHPAITDIHAYRDGAPLSASMLEHLHGCPICRSRLGEMRTLAARFLSPRRSDFDHPETERLVAYGNWLLNGEVEVPVWSLVTAHLSRCEECRWLLGAMAGVANREGMGEGVRFCGQGGAVHPVVSVIRRRRIGTRPLLHLALSP
jgi:hypothetical protein